MAATGDSFTSMSARSIGSFDAAVGPRGEIRAFVDRAAGRSCDLVVLQRRRRFSLLLWRTATFGYVLKIARTAADDLMVTSEFEAVGRLARDTALSPDTYPLPVAIGAIGERAASLITEMPGDKRLLWEPLSESIVAPVARTLEELADAMPHTVTANPEHTRALIAQLAGAPPESLPPAVRDLVVAASVAMNDSPLRPAVLAHGDCTGANVLFGPGRAGLIDWSMAAEHGFEHLDALWLGWHLLTKRLGVAPAEVMQLFVEPGALPAPLRRLLSRFMSSDRPRRERLTLLLLAMLATRHAAEGHSDMAETLSALAFPLRAGPRLAAS
jgi:hypothetical protein